MVRGSRSDHHIRPLLKAAGREAARSFWNGYWAVTSGRLSSRLCIWGTLNNCGGKLPRELTPSSFQLCHLRSRKKMELILSQISKMSVNKWCGFQNCKASHIFCWLQLEHWVLSTSGNKIICLPSLRRKSWEGWLGVLVLANMNMKWDIKIWNEYELKQNTKLKSVVFPQEDSYLEEKKKCK